jgi:hypothetical protein
MFRYLKPEAALSTEEEVDWRFSPIWIVLIVVAILAGMFLLPSPLDEKDGGHETTTASMPQHDAQR